MGPAGGLRDSRGGGPITTDYRFRRKQRLESGQNSQYAQQFSRSCSTMHRRMPGRRPAMTQRCRSGLVCRASPHPPGGFFGAREMRRASHTVRASGRPLGAPSARPLPCPKRRRGPHSGCLHRPAALTAGNRPTTPDTRHPTEGHPHPTPHTPPTAHVRHQFPREPSPPRRPNRLAEPPSRTAPTAWPAPSRTRRSPTAAHPTRRPRPPPPSPRTAERSAPCAGGRAVRPGT